MQTVENGTGDVRRLAEAQRAVAALARKYVGLPEGVSKAMLLDRFERAAPRLGVGEGLVRLVRALVRVTYDQDWEGRYRPLAWPSNDRLGQELDRSRTAIQGLIRGAIRAGLVHMRDSGNGKRYGFRGDRGEIIDGFGFDLSPLAVRYEEFADIAQARTNEQVHRRGLRRRVSELRREIRTLCADALERDVEGFPWLAAIDQASGRLPRSPSVEDLERLEGDMAELLRAVDDVWISAREQPSNKKDLEPTGSEKRAHKEPTTEPKAKRATYQSTEKDVAAASASVTADGWAAEPPATEEALPLSLVLEAIPELHAYLEDPGTADWDQVIAGAYEVALRLGINLSAWREARETMGAHRAAVAVATVLARFLAGEINKSAGGYLRAMCERERAGGLHMLPSLYGLKQRHHPRKSARRPDRTD
jgi:replication initiation protein RepC